jgi:hypothetical protein
MLMLKMGGGHWCSKIIRVRRRIRIRINMLMFIHAYAVVPCPPGGFHGPECII